MNIALIGYGAMGKIVKNQAERKKHQITVIIDRTQKNLTPEELAEKLKVADVAIDFSVAGAVERNVRACLLAKVPLVEGTTGWLPMKDEIKTLVQTAGGAFVFGANFSVGVNLFYRIVSFASGLMAKFDDYQIFIEERHHSRKKDAPSGTALKLKDIVAENTAGDFSIAATRAGNFPGTHIVGFDAAADTIELIHTARSREGFASGAVFAAEWIVGRTGFFEFTDVIDEALGINS